MQGLHSAGRPASLRTREPRQRLSFPTSSWEQFCDHFHPMTRYDGSLLWSGSDIPERLSYRHVWTVTDRSGDRCLVAGRHVLDARGYVLTAVAWPSLLDHQPVYAFPAPIVALYPAPVLGAQASAP